MFTCGCGGGVAYLKGALEHVDEQLVGNDIQLLLILSLNIGLSNCFTPDKRPTNLITKNKRAIQARLRARAALEGRMSILFPRYWRRHLYTPVTLKVKLT